MTDIEDPQNEQGALSTPTEKEESILDEEFLADGDVEQQERRPALVRATRHEMFSGPLPHPEVLRQYNEVLPGCAETIIEQFVAQGNHRRELEKLVIESDIQRANWGLIAGFILGLVGLLGSFYIISIGYNISGLAALVLALGTLIGSFIVTTRKREKERKEKEMVVPEQEADA